MPLATPQSKEGHVQRDFRMVHSHRWRLPRLEPGAGCQNHCDLNAVRSINAEGMFCANVDSHQAHHAANLV